MLAWEDRDAQADGGFHSAQAWGADIAKPALLAARWQAGQRL